jgi:hypothetical protein
LKIWFTADPAGAGSESKAEYILPDPSIEKLGKTYQFLPPGKRLTGGGEPYFSPQGQKANRRRMPCGYREEHASY